ncbi:hypothetical protein SISNIDRAFT_194534 [Sistotremastrum niveocremeum HHB9708]|uniref:Uncharacterized protein n=1 Tax=Sistotremastrum niveocremeum HHB9708 TaxID=1314777 RepID=A0A164ZIC0_9AGAM|nr:hypothetical protein SISNIDRAFT_194534 [Sistotremastrum niveocremeum HHB9708]
MTCESQVANILIATCSGAAPLYPLLDPDPNNQTSLNNHYPGPTPSGQSPCACSYPLYNLLSACGDCQLKSVVPDAYPKYEDWAANCSSFNQAQSWPLTVPNTTTIPLWATLTNSISGGGRWSYGLSYALSRGSVTLNPSISPATSSGLSSTSSPISTAVHCPAIPKNHTGAISAGAAVAGLVVGALVAVAFVYAYNKWQVHGSPPSWKRAQAKSQGGRPGAPSRSASQTQQRQNTDPPITPFVLQPDVSPLTPSSAGSKVSPSRHVSTSEVPMLAHPILHRSMPSTSAQSSSSTTHESSQPIQMIQPVISTIPTADPPAYERKI